MAKQEITLQLVEHEGSGKNRVAMSIIRDEMLEITLILTADECNRLSIGLAEYSRQARGKSIILPGGGAA
jgi:hypothetical protein